MDLLKSCLLVVLSLSLAACGAGPGGEDPVEPVSVDIVEASASVEVGASFQFHANVSHADNNAVSWSVNNVAGGDATVGTIGAGGLYTAPLAVPNPAQATVKAASVEDPSKSDTAVVTITAPPPFTVSPPTANVAAGGTRQFTTTADVNWSLEGADGNTAPLGSIAADGLFTAPLSPPLSGDVTIVATSKSDSSVKATAVATITFSDASLHGPYAFTWRATDAGEMMFAGGCFTADGQGTISDGIMDMNSQTRGSVPSTGVPFTGTYQVQGDGRTYLTLHTTTETFQFRLALVNDSSARMMAFETGRAGAGDLARQDPSSYAAGLSGSYVFSYDGMGSVLDTMPPGGQPIAAAGRFTTTSSGTLTGIAGDININGVWQAGGMGSLSVSGTFTPTNLLTGRGGLNIDGSAGAQQFVFYMLSADEALLVSYDWGSMFPKFGVTGRLSRQAAGPFSKSSLSGSMADLGWGRGAIPVPTPDPYAPPWPAYSGAVITAGGTGTFTGGTADNNMNGTVGQDLSVSGSYDVAANGRGSLTMSAGGTNHAAFCLLAANTAVLVGVDAWGAGVSYSVPQTGGPFSAASLDGKYALALTGTLASAGTEVTGAILLNGLGALAGVVDINAMGTLTQNASAAGTFSLSSNGRGTLTINASSKSWTMTIYAVDSGKILLMGTSAPFSGTLTRQF